MDMTAMKDLLENLPETDLGFLDDARQAAREIVIPKSAFC